MTREEAIHKLDFMKKAYQKLIDEKVDSGKLVGDGVSGEWKTETPLDEAYKSMIDALEMAIKALEQQPCEDCISRKQAIELFVGWWSDLLEYHKEDECFDALLKALPPVTPQQKTGYISIDDAMSAFDDFMCNDIEPEGQEVFLELLKDRAERSGG